MSATSETAETVTGDLWRQGGNSGVPQAARLRLLERELRSSGQGLTIRDMTELTGSTRRTVYRDLDVLEREGVPLYEEEHPDGGVLKVWKVLRDAPPRAGLGAGHDEQRTRARLRLMGEKILALRVESGLTWREMASRTGIMVSTIYAITKGHKVPKLDTIYRLADTLGVDPRELI
jgi:DNA-binding XRE family transcriptional regulator